MLFAGIDNGLNGGIVAIDENQNVILKEVIPIIKGAKTEFDIKMINMIINKLTEIEDEKNIYVALEKAHPRPVQGVRQAFTTGYCFGMFQALLESKGISYIVVNPTVWMKEIFKGNNTTDKKASILFCQRKWPKEVWTATERSKVAHDGLTDSACMALYALQYWRADNGV